MEWTRGQRLGKGGYGEVFIAHPVNPRFPIMAVKSAPEEKAPSLYAEHRILAGLRYTPGIVHCYGGEYTLCHREAGPLTYNLFMEYAPGGSLTNLIADYGAGRLGIPQCHAKVYTRMILRALSVIHSRGIVHCDIKPDNVLVFPPAGNRGGGVCELKIADFGLAVEARRLAPGSNNYRGTTRYVSPEVLVTGTISPAADLWSLGCTVLEMMTGQPPWKGLKKEEVKRAIREGGTPEIPRWLSVEAENFLLWCFVRNPIDRPGVDWFLRHPFVAADRYGGGGGWLEEKEEVYGPVRSTSGRRLEDCRRERRRDPSPAGDRILSQGGPIFLC